MKLCLHPKYKYTDFFCFNGFITNLGQMDVIMFMTIE